MSASDAKATTAVLDKLKHDLEGAAQQLVPWFYENMPEYYFLTHTEEEQVRHLHALISAQVKTERQAVVLKSPCGTRITHIMPGSDMKGLVQSVSLLAEEKIQTARLYTSKDKALRLDTFLLGKQPLCVVKNKPFKNALSQLAQSKQEVEDGKLFNEFLATASEDYVDKFEANRAVRHFNMCRCVEGTERVHVRLESDAEQGFDRIMIAMANPPAKGLLLQALKVFEREGFEVMRAYGDEFDRGPDGTIVVMSFYLDRENGGLDAESERFKRLERQLRACKWFAFHGLEALAEENGWELGRVMLMQAACEFAHQFLIRKNIYAYTSNKIVRTMLRNRELAEKLVSYFEARFDPDLKMGRTERVAEYTESIHAALRSVTDDISRKILGYVFRFFRYVLRTNYYMPNRFGLSFRMDPKVLPPLPDEERPYAFYCFHGPSCFAFHVRYRDMARGGVRVVRTWTQEQFEIESNRLFDEANQLARAQQYKNKDIPEGGSKAVILLGPTGEIDLAVKSMVDSLLDLIVTDEKGRLSQYVVDYLDHEEIIYLGPDENITPEHINWITERAAKRGYRWPNAFMSSKPSTGIGHKRYGVTSEGVIVFAEEVLKYLNIDPHKDPFTVKITGGPAGDVASNVVKILHREYGDKARVVAMSDGHGAIYDPDGLDYDELFRLIKEVKRTSHFDPSKLTGRGSFVVSTDTPEGVRQRDDIHNMAEADIFIPAGGRPDTLNMKNWHRFMKKDGTPSALASVEGANLFISPDARARLEKHGVLCVPGPSANKTGVICSSYEILAGLILEDEEFIEIKDTYVEQLLDILRQRARDEARLLLREYRYAAGTKSLTDISFEVSRAINGLGDTVVEVLSRDVPSLAKDKALCDLLLAYCPQVLVDRYADRIINRIPSRHQFALLAAYIASRILYAEGLGWINKLTRVRPVRDVVYAYLEEEKRVAALVAELRRSKLADKDEIARLVEAGGRKQLTARRLGLS
ncbi:MAG: NAD-glutamate dehydrogenase domain-containing protein [Desulfovibrionaceae bacterium]